MIAQGSRVSIEYTLTLDDGSTADTNVGGEPLVYTHGEGEILEALEQALSGLGVDDERVVRLSAGEGYGEVDPEAFARVEPEAIPQDARHVGAMLVAQDPDGEQRAVRVVQVADEEIVVDFNHPLAGQALNFSVRILAVE